MTAQKNLAVRKTALDKPDSTDALVRDIAMDIGKAVSHHIEMMYQAAVEATSKSMLLSVRNTVYNEIMAAIQVNDEGEIVARLRQRKKHRRNIKAMSNRPAPEEGRAA